MIQTLNGDTVNILLRTGVSASNNVSGLNTTVHTALEKGIIGFDTAPSYRSETLLAESLKTYQSEHHITREQIYVQNKIDVVQMTGTKEDIRAIILSAINKMGLGYLDAYLIHWPIPEYLEKTLDVLNTIKA